MVIIKIRKVLFSLILGLSSLGVSAQTDANFENFAQDFYSLLSDTAAYPNLEYIRVKTWRALIDNQDLSANEKEEWKVEMNRTYPELKASFEQKLGLMVGHYRELLRNGGSLSFAFADYRPHPKWKNLYTCSLKMYYELDEVQSFVEIQYELYYNGRGLVFYGDKLQEAY